MTKRLARVYRAHVESGARPVATPTALSLMMTLGLFGAALLLHQRTENQASAAVETPTFIVRPAAPQQGVSFRDRLIVGLKARTPADVAFVDDVVDEVHAGRLPQRLVDQTFFWARQRAAVLRNGRTRRPVIYFRPAMTLQAGRLGVEL